MVKHVRKSNQGRTMQFSFLTRLRKEEKASKRVMLLKKRWRFLASCVEEWNELIRRLKVQLNYSSDNSTNFREFFETCVALANQSIHDIGNLREKKTTFFLRYWNLPCIDETLTGIESLDLQLNAGHQLTVVTIYKTLSALAWMQNANHCNDFTFWTSIASDGQIRSVVVIVPIWLGHLWV